MHLASLLLLSALAASPPADERIGTPHPFLFQEASPEGGWVYACQAREDTNGDGRLESRPLEEAPRRGDELVPYLFLGPGEGERIDLLLSASPSGRHVAIIREGAVRLLDTHARAEHVLFPLRLEGGGLLATPAPFVDFSPDGRRVLFVREEQGRAAVVLRELASGRERRLDWGRGELHQAMFDPSGEWVLFALRLPRSQDEGPAPEEPPRIEELRCSQPRWALFRPYPDSTGLHKGWRLRRTDGTGPLVEGTDVLQPIGPWLLRRGKRGELYVQRPEGGRRVEWVPARCGARIAHVDVERRQLLAACAPQQAEEAVEQEGVLVGELVRYGLYGERGARRLPLQSEPALVGGFFDMPTRVVMFGPSFIEGVEESADLPHALIDLERRTVRPLSPDLELRGSWGPHVLWTRVEGVHQRTQAWLLDVRTGRERRLGDLVEGPWAAGTLWAGHVWFHGGLLVDLRAGRVLGRAEGFVLAIDTRGRVLRPVAPPPENAGAPGLPALPLGPVRWVPGTPP
jgi:hypothetical protein